MPPNSQSNAMAQGVYIAQLFAAKGACNCAACKALRTATDGMIAEFNAPKIVGEPSGEDLRAPVS